MNRVLSIEAVIGFKKDRNKALCGKNATDSKCYTFSFSS